MRSSSTGMKEDHFIVLAHSRIIRYIQVHGPLVTSHQDRIKPHRKPDPSPLQSR